MCRHCQEIRRRQHAAALCLNDFRRQYFSTIADQYSIHSRQHGPGSELPAGRTAISFALHPPVIAYAPAPATSAIHVRPGFGTGGVARHTAVRH
jgi:hypothetical protein